MRYHLYTLTGTADVVSDINTTNAYRFCYNTREKAINVVEGIYGNYLKMVNTRQIGLTVYKTLGDFRYCFIVDERHPLFNLYIAAVGPNFPREWTHHEITYLVLKNLVRTFKKNEI